MDFHWVKFHLKDFMKKINSLENKGILSKKINRKISCQKEGFLDFLRPLLTTGLLLMKILLTPLVRTILMPLGLLAAASA